MSKPAARQSTAMKTGRSCPLVFLLLFPYLANADSISAKDLFDMSLAELMQVNIGTGRVGTSKRLIAETSYSITTIDANSLRLQAPSSVVDAVKSVPGFWIENSGGDASENIRARGIPNSGFQSVNLLEDGIPVQHDPYPNSMATDQSFRFDETTDHIEVVRGGPASIFYAYAPAGVINFIPRKVSDSSAGLVKFIYGEDGLARTDIWYGTPLANGWKASVGGFYRSGTGLRDPGYTAYHGGQARLNLSKEWQDGQVSIDLKHLDDTVPFYVDGPMQKNADGSIDAVAGFDATRGNYTGPEFQHIQLNRADGTEHLFNSAEGTNVARDQLTVKFDLGLADSWRLSDALRVSNTESNRNDVTPLTISSTATFLVGQTASASQFGVSQLQLVYAQSKLPATLANGLIMTADVSTNRSDFNELGNDLQLHRTFDWFGQAHDLTLGYTYARYRQDVDQTGSIVLMAARNQAPLLGLAGTNLAGQLELLTDPNGVIRQGSVYANDTASVRSHALYVSDEWQLNERWRIDSGIRWEQANTQGRSPILQQFNLGRFAARSVSGASGNEINFDKTFDHTGWTLGANYQLNPTSVVFARITPTYRLPGLNNYTPNESTRSQIIQTMTLSEIGYKFSNSVVQFYPTLFYTTYDNVTNNSKIYDPTTNLPITQAGFATTRTQGLELEGKLTPTEAFDLTYSATWQSARYQDFAFTNTVNGSTSALITTDYSGNQLVRIPSLSYRIAPGLNLLEGKLRLQLTYEYAGKRFADTANTVTLPAFSQLNFSTHYKLSDTINLFCYLDNVTNSTGLTEGNPRAGEIQSADLDATSFLARSILGRNFRVALKYDF